MLHTTGSGVESPYMSLDSILQNPTLYAIFEVNFDMLPKLHKSAGEQVWNVKCYTLNF